MNAFPVPTFLRRLFGKKSDDPEGPSTSEDSSVETTQKKIEEIPEHDDSVSLSKEQKPPEQEMEVECGNLTDSTQNPPVINEIFFREEEFEPHNEGAWEEYESYFPSGLRVSDSKPTLNSTVEGSYIAQVGDTDVEDQQKLDSKESFPDAFEVQHWELRKISSTVIPVLNILYLASPKSGDEETDCKRKKRKKRRRRRYYW